MTTTIENRLIDCFDGYYRFLSNFYICPVTYNGITYPNSEAAFQAQKCLERANEFLDITPGQAKRLGKRVPLRAGWDDIRDDIMYEVVKAKFEQNPDLLRLLIQTGTAELIEGNTWNDTYWGVCDGIGKNRLGKTLMKVRAEFSAAEAK